MLAHSLAPGNLPSHTHPITGLPPQLEEGRLLLANQRPPPTCLTGSGMGRDPPDKSKLCCEASREALGLAAQEE